MRAEGWEALGEDTESIRQARGWHEGLVGSWRSEVSGGTFDFLAPLGGIDATPLLAASIMVKLGGMLRLAPPAGGQEGRPPTRGCLAPLSPPGGTGEPLPCSRRAPHRALGPTREAGHGADRPPGRRASADRHRPWAGSYQALSNSKQAVTSPATLRGSAAQARTGSPSVSPLSRKRARDDTGSQPRRR